MTIRRVKLLVIVAGALFGGLTLIAWTQQWFVLSLTSGQSLPVAGQVAAPALSALGLASLPPLELLLVGGETVVRGGDLTKTRSGDLASDAAAAARELASRA